jgi:WD40 repeat protein
MQTARLMIAAGIVLIPGAIASGDDEPRLPSTAPPVRVIARMDQEGRVVLRVPITEYQPTETRVQQEGKEQTILTPAPVVREETYRLSCKDVKVLGTDGQQVEREALAGRLKEEVPALYAVGEAVDTLHLRILKEGTLTIVVPSSLDVLEVPRMLAQLGDDRFFEREAASRRLEAIGEVALPALWKAATTSADPEVRLRAEQLVRVISARTYGEVGRFEGHSDGVITAAISPDGRYALSGPWFHGRGTERAARLWDMRTGKEIRRFEAHTSGVLSVGFSPDGKLALSAGDSGDNAIRLWDVETGTERKRLLGHRMGVLAAVFSPDGKRVLSGSFDRTMRLWDVETGKELRRFAGLGAVVRSVALSPDGRQALSGCFDAGVRLWDVETGRELRRFSGHAGAIHGLSFSPDGRRALSGAMDGTVRLWEVASGKELRVFRHDREVHHVAFSPDGRRLLSASFDGSVRLWDAETGLQLCCFTGHTDQVWWVAFTPDSRYALSSGADKTLRLWRLPGPDDPH